MPSTILVARLSRFGIWSRHNRTDGRVTIVASPAFFQIVHACGLSTPRCCLETPTSLRRTCEALAERMMQNDLWEGVVLSGPGGVLYKWKTGQEDESHGGSRLREALAHPVAPDRPFLEILARVASNRTGATLAAVAKIKRGAAQAPAYSNETLEAAIASAISKYDALYAFFARKETKSHKQTIAHEVETDLEAETDLQRGLIASAVGHAFGRAHAEWRALD